MPTGIYKHHKRSKESIEKQKKTRLLKYGKNQPGTFKKGEHKSKKTEFKKGNNPWNKGIEWEEMKGENHPNWQGGITPETRRLRNSAKYKIWRNLCFLRDDFTCQECGNNDYVVVHHVKYWSEHPELRFKVDNGITLCRNCHDKIHKSDRIKWTQNLHQKN